MKSLFKLIRFPNLLIIAFTQYAMRYLIMDPLLPSAGFSLQMSNFYFMLLVLSTIFIAAAGYIINDYFDTQPDRINKPHKMVVGVQIDRRAAMTLHTIFNVLGVGIGIFLSFYVKIWTLSFIFFFTAGLLWFYSTSYKRQFLVGNLTISFLTAMVPLMVVLFEIPLLNREYGEIMLQYHSSFNYIFLWVSGFSIFAFLVTLIREIIKDAEDFEGDSAYGMKTIPIVLGIKWTKTILFGLILSMIVMLIFVLVKFILFSVEQTDFMSLIYFSAFLLLPLFILQTLILLAKSKVDFHRASIIIKLIMLFGVLYSGLVYYIIKYWI